MKATIRGNGGRRTRWTRVSGALLFLLAFGAGCSAPHEEAAPDRIYHGGTVLTADDSFRVAEGVAVRDGRIVAVGDADDLAGLSAPGTEWIDLQGRTMMPGFIDNHVHLGPSSGPLQEWRGGLIDQVPEWIRGVSTKDEVVRALRSRASTVPEGEWITGALSREVWPNSALPTNLDLDRGSTAHPIVLSRGPHTLILNSRAMELAGIDRSTGSPPGGEVKRHEGGEPNGILYDAAHRLVEDVAPSDDGGPVDDETGIENMRRLLLQFAGTGVTSVNVAGIRPDDFRLFQELYERHGSELPRATVQVRLRPGYDTYDDLEVGIQNSIEEMESIGFVTGYGNDRLRLGAIKMSIDGGLSAPVFWSTEEYENRPGFTGVVRIPAEAFYPVARRAHELGWQLGIHTMGDAAAEMVVEQMARILEEMPRSDHRHYLHHVAVKPSDETIETMARLGIGVASQPAFTVGLGSYAEEALAGEREETMNPTKSLLDAGVWVSWGSDGAPYGPRVSIWTGVTRKGWDGEVYGPQEAVDRERAIRLHTRWPAYQTFDEERKGTIEVGKLADFVVVEGDPLTMPADSLRYLPVVSTIVGGREIHSAPAGDGEG